MRIGGLARFAEVALAEICTQAAGPVGAGAVAAEQEQAKEAHAVASRYKTAAARCGSVHRVQAVAVQSGNGVTCRASRCRSYWPRTSRPGNSGRPSRAFSA